MSRGVNRRHVTLGVDSEGPDGFESRGREKSKCTRLTYVESEYDPRTKKKQR